MDQVRAEQGFRFSLKTAFAVLSVSCVWLAAYRLLGYPFLAVSLLVGAPTASLHLLCWLICPSKQPSPEV